MTARFLIGDTRAVTATIPDGSVDLVMTSPPFLALRSYLPAGHPAKHLEIGSEPDPATFLDVMLALTAEWGRVLAPHGSICVELGDTYAGSGGAGGDYGPDGMRGGQTKFKGSALADRKNKVLVDGKRLQQGPGWPLAKSLCGIPHLYHLSLAYGRNLLTGEPSPAGQWRVRNVVAWCRPNPPVGALGDKYRPATSYLTIATKARDRYFDLDAVRGNPVTPHVMRVGAATAARGGKDPNDERTSANPAGAPPLDYWIIPPAPYTGSHYAVYPPALCERPIESMVPRKVCTVCGEPSRRIVEKERHMPPRGDGSHEPSMVSRMRGKPLATPRSGLPSGGATTATTTGWSDCGHGSYRNGVVLDPFAGSGTTLMVASGHGRDSIGIDLDERNAELARDRVGPLLLEVEDMREKAAS